MNIVVLNSAPGGGKDTIASYIVNHVKGTYKAEVKALLFDLAIRMSGLNRETWFALYNDRRFKESPCPYLIVGGKQVSLREYLIHISEHVMKPLFGNDFFGKQSAQRLANLFEGNETVVFSDGGFIEEVKELSELALKADGKVYGTFLDGENLYSKSLDTGIENPVIIVIGNESEGISKAMSALVSDRLYIPPYPQDSPGSESLNAAIATAITVAEFRRRS